MPLAFKALVSLGPQTVSKSFLKVSAETLEVASIKYCAYAMLGIKELLNVV